AIKGLTIRGGCRGVYSSSWYGDVSIENCVIADNNGTTGNLPGGGLYFYVQFANISNCYIVNNAAYEGGGVYIEYCEEASLTNCVFWNNEGEEYGGGLYLLWTPTTIGNCTFAKNHAGSAGALYDYESGAEVSNSIFWNDSDEDEDGANEIGIGFYWLPAFKNCCIEECGGSGSGWDPTLFGVDIEGNIESDPRFAAIHNPVGNDGRFGTVDDGLRLRLDSPCIDTGYNDDVPGYPDNTDPDIIGHARIVDGDDVAEAVVDMGAYESSRTWYVNKNADGADNGTSWTDAYPNLEDALTSATAGDEIWVAQGTYAGDVPFELADGVSLYGGFYGTEDSIVQRRLELFRSILSGNEDHTVIHSAPGALLDGFTIIWGKLYGPGGPDDGGGILISSGEDTTLRNCFVAGNRAEGNGGGVHVTDAELKIINCVFAHNNMLSGYNRRGGGLYCNNATVEIRGSTFQENCSETGGAIYAVSSTLELQNVIVYGNFADAGSEIYNDTGSTISYSFCDIKGSNGSGSDWDSSLGTDAGNNIDSDPCFVGTNDLRGPDKVFGTPDDYLKLKSGSSCIDKGNADVGLLCDIAGLQRQTGRGLSQQGNPEQVDIGAFEYVRSELPYMTSFEENQGCEVLDSVDDIPGWSVEAGSAVIATATWYEIIGDKAIQHPYNYIKASESSTFNKNLSTYNDAYNYLRISCIPSDNASINVMCGTDKVASIKFNKATGKISVLDNGTPVDSTISYGSIEDYCRDCLNYDGSDDPPPPPPTDY
ncbi:MAG: choice-of-anchor Q domain-containing protein, partial [Planctomycetota bacterium]